MSESIRRAIPMIGAAYKTPAGENEPAPNTVRWWGLQKQWPHWLVAAMAAQCHINEELPEDTAHALAEATACLPLGAPRGVV